MSRRLWGGGNTSPLKTTAWEARSKLTNQNKGKFPERSAHFCNVVEFSNFVVKLLSVFLHVIGPLTKKVAFHCSQLTL